MQELVKQGKWQGSLNLLQEMELTGLRPNTASYETAMVACEKGKQWEQALSLMEKLKARGLEGDATYQRVVAEVGREGGSNWQDVLGAMDRRSKAGGVKPSPKSYQVAVRACSEMGQWGMALELLEEMKAAGQTPGRACYGHVVHVLGGVGEWSKVDQLMQEMAGGGEDTAPDAAVYTAALAACGEMGGQWEQALKLLERMRGDGLMPGWSAYRAAIVACAEAARWDEVVGLLKALKGAEGAHYDHARLAKVIMFESGRPGKPRSVEDPSWQEAVQMVEPGALA
ncbi:unnamed protein product [Chrysoparadoxa australica]